MKRLILIAALLLPVGAVAASFNMSLVLTTAASTSVTCNTTTMQVPVAAGTKICDLVVQPAGWQGVFTLTGPDAGLFVLAGATIIVGPAPLTTARTYTATVQSLP